MPFKNTSKDISTSTKKTKTIQVPSDKVGLVIGRGGANVKSITKDAKDGCRIQFIKDSQGTFEISAYSSKAILFAEIKIKELLQGKKTNKSSNGTPKEDSIGKGNVFSHLNLHEEEERQQGIPNQLGNCTLLSSKKTSKETIPTSFKKRSEKTTLQTNFTLSGGSIQDRKREHYLSRKAKEYKTFTPSSSSSFTQGIPSQKDFPENPSFRKVVRKENTWSIQKPSITITKPSVTIPTTNKVHSLVSSTQSIKSSSTKQSSLDDEDWGEEESFTKVNNPFQNEIDNWDDDVVHTKIVFA